MSGAFACVLALLVLVSAIAFIVEIRARRSDREIDKAMRETDEMMKRGFRAAHKRGWLRVDHEDRWPRVNHTPMEKR